VWSVDVIEDVFGANENVDSTVNCETSHRGNSCIEQCHLFSLVTCWAHLQQSAVCLALKVQPETLAESINCNVEPAATTSTHVAFTILTAPFSACHPHKDPPPETPHPDPLLPIAPPICTYLPPGSLMCLIST